MHKHKQSQCKRKVKHRKNVMGLIIFCITVCIVFMFAYYQNLRKEISVRQEWLETVLTREKKWILENQGPEGEIYMNGSKAGDVNPYFACMAALGLLAETKNCPMTETEQKAVGRYLDWHTGVLLETDGKMGIYRKEGGELIYKEKADSEDGYLGMYLFLMGKYLEKTESTDLPESWKNGISLALKKIQINWLFCRLVYKFVYALSLNGKIMIVFLLLIITLYDNKNKFGRRVKEKFRI